MKPIGFYFFQIPKLAEATTQRSPGATSRGSRGMAGAGCAFFVVGETRTFLRRRIFHISHIPDNLNHAINTHLFFSFCFSFVFEKHSFFFSLSLLSIRDACHSQKRKDQQNNWASKKFGRNGGEIVLNMKGRPEIRSSRKAPEGGGSDASVFTYAIDGLHKLLERGVQMQS